MKKTIFALAAIGIGALGQAAYAADGTINITGNIVGTTCTINGGTTNVDVALPPVSTTALAAAGQTAGSTPFRIALTNCSADQKVSTHFEAGPTVNQETGRLIVDAGGAKNVEIGLLNDAHQPIVAGAAHASQNSQEVDIVGGVANLDYFARYEATGVAGAGAANSRVQYTLVYQ